MQPKVVAELYWVPMRKSHFLYVVISICLSCVSASAQTASDLRNIFGGLVRSAEALAVRARWEKLPPKEIACVDQALRQRGENLNSIISRGITPDDLSVTEFRYSCRVIIEQPTVTAADDTSIYVVANTKGPDAFLSLRTDPSIEVGGRISKMPNGTALQVLQRRQDNWWRVKLVSSGQEGWALSGQGNSRWIVCCANAPTNSPVSSTEAQGSPRTYWSYEGSILYLQVDGSRREFYFQEPSQADRDAGANRGALFFSGKAVNGLSYAGDAFVFNKPCNNLSYKVSGPILDGYARVLLEGDSPIGDPDCHIIGYAHKKMELVLLKPQPVFNTLQASGTEPTATSSIQSPPQSKAQLDLAEIDGLRSRLMKLWQPPEGSGSSNSQVTVRIRLTRDRMLETAPQVLNTGDGPGFAALKESALRAIALGQPYSMLLPEHYETWKEIDFTFDLGQLRGDGSQPSKRQLEENIRNAEAVLTSITAEVAVLDANFKSRRNALSSNRAPRDYTEHNLMLKNKEQVRSELAQLGDQLARARGAEASAQNTLRNARAMLERVNFQENEKLRKEREENSKRLAEAEKLRKAAETEAANRQAAEQEAREMPLKGEAFLKENPTSWTYEEQKDRITGKVTGKVTSRQEDNGVVGSITGQCANDRDRVSFSVIIVDGNGKPTIGISNSKDGSVLVRYRLNDKVSSTILHEKDFKNQFNLFSAVNEKFLQNPFQAALLTVSETFYDYSKAWGVIAEFKTTAGDLIVAIPTRHPAIQKLYQSCFN